ncbi:MAG TPA: VWA domain-containing protein [Chloroflexota bacterium]|nr:VWA domain-containing protein [Chloroflexota bacterium]
METTLQQEEQYRPVAGALLHRVVRFSRALRDAGIEANPGRVSDLINALPIIDLSRRDDFYYTCRSTMLSRNDQREAFDAIFAYYWPPVRVSRDEGSEGSSGASGDEQEAAPGEEGEDGDAQAVSKVFTQQKADAEGADENEEQSDQKQGATTAKTSYSSDESLREKNFGEFTDAELLDAKRLMEQLQHQMARRLTRRTSAARAGRKFDLRRTVRRAFTTGGETLSFARKERKIKPRPLVLICDVSGSMERYTRALLHFLHVVSHATGASVETFVFATRLTRVTPSLKRRRVDEALDRVSEDVTDWSGGTRTGEALSTFNRQWGRRVLGRGAIAMIIADGWDRGDAELLGNEMERLRRTSYRLLWLNPLLGSPGYRPLTRGMQAALPHLDEFLPAHNLKALEQLVHKLAALPIRRAPDRRGNPKIAAMFAKK